MSRPRLAVSSVWLCLIVVPWPSVGQEVLPGYESIRYEGRCQVPLEELETQSGLRVGGSVSVHAVREAVKRLESLYHLRGFPSAKVEIIDGLRISDRKVTFRITEGAKQINAPSPVASGQAGAASLFTQLAFEPPAKPAPIAETTRPPDLYVPTGPDPLANAGARPSSEARAVAPPIGPEPALDPAFTASLEAKSQLQMARDALAGSDWVEALDRAAVAIERARTARLSKLIVEAHVFRAEIYRGQQLYRHAIAEETAAIAEEPGNTEVLVQRATDRIANLDFQGADADLRAARRGVSESKHVQEILSTRACFLFARGDFAAALTLFEQLYATGELLPAHFEMRARARWHAGRLHAAIEDFNRLIEKEATADRLLERAWVHFLVGDPAQVIADVDQALQLNNGKSDPKDVLTLRAFAQLAQGRVDDSIAEFQRNIDHGDPSGTPLVGLGWAYLAQGKLTKAEQAFEQADAKLGHRRFRANLALSTDLPHSPAFEQPVEIFLHQARACPGLSWSVIILRGNEGRSARYVHPFLTAYLVVRIPGMSRSVPFLVLELSARYEDEEFKAGACLGEAIVRLRQRDWSRAIKAAKRSFDIVVEARRQALTLLAD